MPGRFSSPHSRVLNQAAAQRRLPGCAFRCISRFGRRAEREFPAEPRGETYAANEYA